MQGPTEHETRAGHPCCPDEKCHALDLPATQLLHLETLPSADMSACSAVSTLCDPVGCSRQVPL